MLLEFELENDGSFGSAAQISLIASHLKDSSPGAIREVGDIAQTKALTSALILGKNGSGKSTFVNALTYVSNFVRNSAKETKDQDALSYDPNILIDGGETRPTRYRVVFSVQDIMYEFGIEINAVRILEEYLTIADKSSRFRRLYHRTWSQNNSEYEYIFGEALTGNRVSWQNQTREDALYLSTAVLLNSDVLAPAHKWLSNFVRTARMDGFVTNYTSRRCLKDADFREKVVMFLQAMDVNVSDIEVKEEAFDRKVLQEMFSSEFLKKLEKDGGLINEDKRLSVKFKKSTQSGDVKSLSLDQESTGTQALFQIAGPLFDTLEKGYCLVIDEINTSLHPLVVQFLVKLFSNEEINVKRAQLIFTSHDVSILREGVLRRDQIWFIENDGVTADIVPLSDYSPRKQEALEKWYLSGKYGGIPAILPGLIRLSHA